MQRALALRSRLILPAALKHELPLMSYRRSQRRQSDKTYSTAQDSRLWSREGLPPPMMNNGSKPGNSEKSPNNLAGSPPALSRDPNANSHDSSGFRYPTDVSPWPNGRLPDNLVAGYKRKPEVAAERPSQRRRTASKRESSNLGGKKEDDISEKISFLSKEAYPRLPDGIEEEPKLHLHNASQGRVKLSSTFSSHARASHLCHVIWKGMAKDGLTILHAEGVASNKKEAEKAAYLQLLSKLHTSGDLVVLYGASKVDQLDSRTMREERDAKEDIYNYAARYGCVPKITARKVPATGARARFRNSMRRSPGPHVEVTVELPEQNITVSALGTDLQMAEIAASIKFKKEAERFHIEKGTNTLIVKDSTTLNTGNAQDFFDYYKMKIPGATIQVNVELSSEYMAFHRDTKRGQVFLNQEAVGEPVHMRTKVAAERLAYLTAAVAVVNIHPDLLPKFLAAKRDSSGKILTQISPITMPVFEDCVLLMRETLLSARRAGLGDEYEELASEETSVEVRPSNRRRPLDRVQAERRSIQLERTYRDYQTNSQLESLRKTREELPMNQYRSQVLEIVDNNTYSIIVGATGSGKTTQVPQIILEQSIQKGKGGYCSILCTQPRRIAATSVARRVADERVERIQETVGYHVRFDSRLPPTGGSITYCTTGILLQQLQHSPDEVFDRISHLIIDEVHERDIVIDFLLIILKKVMAERIKLGKSTPKVVLMSATMDADLFASYFATNSSEVGATNCPTLSVPGRAFPVNERYLENIVQTLNESYGTNQLKALYSDPATVSYLDAEKIFAEANPTNSASPDLGLPGKNSQEDDSIINWKQERVMTVDGEVNLTQSKENALVPHALVAMTIAHIVKTTKEGAILVFLPGLDDMTTVEEILLGHKLLDIDFKDESKYKLFMLHSSIASTQTEVFDTVITGCRKIIIATNIAETSITIPDVRYVVDTGKLREKQYDQLSRITRLQCTWISKSNSKQRAGRAGRVQDGHYYALFSWPRRESLRAVGLPEILRSDLQETCLDVKAQAFQFPIREFLADAIEPPAAKAVDTAVANLQSLDCLTVEEKITPLGRLLASLPVHPSLGKMIVLGIIFRCLEPMIVLGAAAEERGLFNNPLAARQEANAAKQSFVKGSNSDHIAVLSAFAEMRHTRRTRGEYAMKDFANKNFIHVGAFRTIDSTAKQIVDILIEAGLVPKTVSTTDYFSSQYGGASLNENSLKVYLIKALALAGLNPNIAVAFSSRVLRTAGERATVIHPSSCNATSHKSSSDRNSISSISRDAVVAFSTLAKSNDNSTPMLRETSLCTPLMATLFGGRLQMSSDSPHVIEVDDWLPFYVRCNDRRAAKTIYEFRKALERILTGAFKALSLKRLLTDDKIRDEFAEGLVAILEMHVEETPGAVDISKGTLGGFYQHRR